jgi:hypothetical protein
MANLNQHLNHVKHNLQYLKQALDTGTYQEQKPILQVLLAESIEAVRETTLNFDMYYDNDRYTYHVYAYVLRIKKAKAELIVMLQELQYELSRKQVNVKRSLLLVNRLLDTELNTKDVQETIEKWVSINPRVQVKTRRLEVK